MKDISVEETLPEKLTDENKTLSDEPLKKIGY
jgi:hypothetical protein